MTITSIGYAGSIGWSAWAQMARDLGTDYGIDGVDDLKVTVRAASAGEVSVAPGTAHGQGIVDTSDSAITIAGLTADDTWYTIAVRRDWTGGPGAEVTTILALPGSAAKAIAAARQVGAGVIDDQPIALVHRGSTLDQVVDLRCWWGNGGLLAASTDALAYLGRPGSHVRVGSSVWRRDLGAAWVELSDDVAASRVSSGVLAVDRIPDLDASKVGSGTFSAGRIPVLDASKVGSGTFSADRIPSIDQSKVTGPWRKAVDTAESVSALSFYASSLTNQSIFNGQVVVGKELSVGNILWANGGLRVGAAALTEVTLGLPRINNVTNSANVYISSGGYLNRSTSRRDAKVSIEDAPASWAEAFWKLRPRTWFDRGDAERLAAAMKREAQGSPVDWDQVAVEPLTRIPGFVAEEVEEAGLPEFVMRDRAGRITGLAYDRMLAAAIAAMHAERARTDALEEKVAELAETVAALTEDHRGDL